MISHFDNDLMQVFVHLFLIFLLDRQHLMHYIRPYSKNLLRTVLQKPRSNVFEFD